jgi:ribosomal protein L40E
LTRKEAAMFCRNCGTEMPKEADFCTSCGVKHPKGEKYCQACGAESRPEADVCVACGARLRKSTRQEGKSWLIALLLSLFVGQLGIDRFYLGLIGTGILKLVTFGGFGIWWLVDLILIATNNLRDSEGRRLVQDPLL